ncbi:MAG: archaemetzincin family Zn-dependent metalloprotease [Dehalococcoidia bacterium]
MNIDLVPMGDANPDVIQGLKGGLNAILGCPVHICDPIPIPTRAFDTARNQYLSDALIDCLRQHRNNSTHLLGITEVNIYTHDLNFLFGQADSDGRVAIISLNLLRGENYGLPSDKKLLGERALKEAVHELGHTMGLGHCMDGSCVMHFSNSLIDTDLKGSYFCSRCQPKLIV